MALPPRALPLLPGLGKEAPGLQASLSGSSVLSVCAHGICHEVLWARQSKVNGAADSKSQSLSQPA